MDLHRWQQYSFQGLQNGSMHIDVHPDIAERLNNILSAIVPLALPADRMAHSKKSLEAFPVLKQCIDFDTRMQLSELMFKMTGTINGVAGHL